MLCLWTCIGGWKLIIGRIWGLVFAMDHRDSQVCNVCNTRCIILSFLHCFLFKRMLEFASIMCTHCHLWIMFFFSLNKCIHIVIHRMYVCVCIVQFTMVLLSIHRNFNFKPILFLLLFLLLNATLLMLLILLRFKLNRSLI
jgi:hypothetical protein